MKKFILTIFFIAYQAYFSMAYAENNSVLNASAELEKIKQEKHVIDSDLKNQEAACYKKFAVSNCLQEAKTTAQNSLNAIKLRELEIKNSQRNAKIEFDGEKKNDKKKNIKFNADETASLESKTVKSRKTKSITADDEILEDKTTIDRLRSEQAKKRVDDSSRKLATSQKKNKIRENKINQSTENTTRYNQKMALAASKKAASDKESSERRKPKSAPLPIPSTFLTPITKAP